MITLEVSRLRNSWERRLPEIHIILNERDFIDVQRAAVLRIESEDVAYATILEPLSNSTSVEPYLTTPGSRRKVHQQRLTNPCENFNRLFLLFANTKTLCGLNIRNHSRYAPTTVVLPLCRHCISITNDVR